MLKRNPWPKYKYVVEGDTHVRKRYSYLFKKGLVGWNPRKRVSFGQISKQFNIPHTELCKAAWPGEADLQQAAQIVDWHVDKKVANSMRDDFALMGRSITMDNRRKAARRQHA